MVGDVGPKDVPAFRTSEPSTTQQPATVPATVTPAVSEPGLPQWLKWGLIAAAIYFAFTYLKDSTEEQED